MCMRNRLSVLFSALISVATALTTSGPVYANDAVSSSQQYMFSYSKLYSYKKHDLDPELTAVKTGIYFVDQSSHKLCAIEKAWMEKEEKYEQLQVSATNELLLPLDSNLKKANPLVFIDTEQGKRCDFSIVVMAKQAYTNQISYQDIQALVPQMQSLLEEHGGMFASWFTPKVEGVILEFNQQQGVLKDAVTFSNGSSVDLVNGRVQISLDQIDPGESVPLPASPIRVLPWLPEAK